MYEPDPAPSHTGEPDPERPLPPPGPPPAAPMPGVPAPPPGVAPRPATRMATGWKVVIAGLILLTLLSMGGCCSMAMVAGLGSDPLTAFADSVAVIHIDGVIAGTGSSFDGVITPEATLAHLDRAAADPNVKAVLLRVDSPGGTVAASQEIATEVQRLSEIKPVVASVGDVGASGAYMIASQCDEIWAQPTSAIGSIGVITQIPNLAGLLDKLGIEFTVLTAGEYKDAGSPYRSLTTTETDLIQHEVDIAYDEFITIVADGRGIDEADVREMATGWAWSGRRALEMELIDDLGTYNDALDRAADLGGIDGGYDIITYDVYSYGDLFYYLFGVREDLDRILSAVPGVGPAAPALTR